MPAPCVCSPNLPLTTLSNTPNPTIPIPTPTRPVPQNTGFGGRKSLKKQNDAYSAADMDGYRPGKFKESFGARKGGVQKKAGGGGAKGGKGAQRPGKQRRQAMKGGKGGRR